MARSSLVLALLVLLAAPAAALVTRPLPSRSTAPALRLRGGLSSVDSTVVAKLSTGLGVVSGGYLGLAADKACTAYGIKADGKSDGLTKFILENMGWLLLAVSMTGALTITGSSVEKADGWALLPYSVATSQAILQGRPARLGIDVSGQIMCLSIMAFVMHACFTEAAYVDTALKAFASFYLVMGVLQVVAPLKTAQGWGIAPGLIDDLDRQLFKTYGYFVGEFAVLLLSLMHGNAPSVAWGHARVVTLLCAFDNLFISRVMAGPNYFTRPKSHCPDIQLAV